MGGFRALLTLFFVANIKQISTLNNLDDSIDPTAKNNGQPVIFLIAYRAPYSAQEFLLKANKIKKLMSLLSLTNKDVIINKLNHNSDSNNEQDNYVPDKTNKNPQELDSLKNQKNIGHKEHIPLNYKKASIIYNPDKNTELKDFEHRNGNKPLKPQEKKYAFIYNLENNDDKNDESSQEKPDKNWSSDIDSEYYPGPEYIDRDDSIYQDIYKPTDTKNENTNESDSKDINNELGGLLKFLEQVQGVSESKRDVSAFINKNKPLDDNNNERLDKFNPNVSNAPDDIEETYVYKPPDTVVDDNRPYPKQEKPMSLESLLNLLTVGVTKAKNAYHETTHKYWSSNSDHGLPNAYMKPDYLDYRTDNDKMNRNLSPKSKSGKKNFEYLYNLLSHGVTDYKEANEESYADDVYEAGFHEDFNRPDSYSDSEEYDYSEDDDYRNFDNEDVRKLQSKKKRKLKSFVSMFNSDVKNKSKRGSHRGFNKPNRNSRLISDESDYYMDGHDIFPEEYKEYPDMEPMPKIGRRKEVLSCNLVLKCDTECLYKCE